MFEDGGSDVVGVGVLRRCRRRVWRVRSLIDGLEESVVYAKDDKREMASGVDVSDDDDDDDTMTTTTTTTTERS